MISKRYYEEIRLKKPSGNPVLGQLTNVITVE